LTTTQAATLASDAARRNETWQIALVSAAHFVSHYYIIILPPLFLFVRAEYGVSYTELGLALVAFNVVTAVLQTPAGFLVDRIGARPLLIGGLALGGVAFTVIGLIPSFWLFVAMFAVAGLANTVYHPADYAILSQSISPERMSHAFSVHTFAGMLGGAAAPVSLLLIQSYAGWRGAFIVAGMLGFATAAILAAYSRATGAGRPRSPKPADAAAPATGWRLLLSLPILQNLLFFVLLALTNGGLQNYAVVTLGALYGTPTDIANTALSAFLLLSALGVLVGGVLASRIPRHALIAALGLCGSALVALVIGLYDLGALALIAAMSLGGLLNGVIMPSRDMIVREITPPGSFGKVFGFVTTGFNIGGIIAPLVFGALLDHGMERGVFFCVALGSLASVLTVITIPKLRAA
jgi:FSR family fosmidomycin resistance protein-like MFS transporter